MLTIPYIEKLAQVLTGFSTKISKGDHVLIEAWDTPQPMLVALIRAVRTQGAIPFVQLHDTRISRELLREGVAEQFTQQCAFELPRIQHMNAYIAVRAAHNIFESCDVPAECMRQWMHAYKPVLDWRVSKTKWVVLRWPSPSMAQQAGMSTEAFEEFFFRVCTLDYERMTVGMHALKMLMQSTNQVYIQGPGTDLHFSIKGVGAVACGGKHNIPDGEVFTAPVKESVEGVIAYNTPTVYQGIAFDQVKLKFKAGKIIEATASDTRRLNQILDEDMGARYIGEFALGFNPHILEPMRDILFDEKIAGSFHFTPGQAYEDADNGNRSQVHWDLVCIQRPEYGGGTIHFDGKLIRKDGLFVVPELESLNPDKLLAPV